MYSSAFQLFDGLYVHSVLSVLACVYSLLHVTSRVRGNPRDCQLWLSAHSTKMYQNITLFFTFPIVTGKPYKGWVYYLYQRLILYTCTCCICHYNKINIHNKDWWISHYRARSTTTASWTWTFQDSIRIYRMRNPVVVANIPRAEICFLTKTVAKTVY